VVILYENSPSREQALQFWSRMEKQYPPAGKSDVSWWTFELLEDATEAGKAMKHATLADLIVFAAGGEGELPEAVKLWIESWLGKRGEREGAIVGLVKSQAGLCVLPGMKEIYLRQVAHRAGLDYLSEIPPTGSLALPDSLDSFCDRAGRITSVLDEILRARVLPGPPS
jgi:hypothetical protein